MCGPLSRLLSWFAWKKRPAFLKVLCGIIECLPHKMQNRLKYEVTKAGDSTHPSTAFRTRTAPLDSALVFHCPTPARAAYFSRRSVGASCGQVRRMSLVSL